VSHFENQKLVGFVTRSWSLSDDRTDLTLVGDDESVVLTAYGDCCSEAWIEHIEGIEHLIDSPIVDVEEIEGADLPGTRQEYDLSYFFKIRTNKGMCDIDFRNSSNGYYGSTLLVRREARA
jgi:hypothetical protein